MKFDKIIKTCNRSIDLAKSDDTPNYNNQYGGIRFVMLDYNGNPY